MSLRISTTGIDVFDVEAALRSGQGAGLDIPMLCV